MGGGGSEWVFPRPGAVAPEGMITADPRAAEAGVEILREGGNALDAALATAFALGVTSPVGSGVGGIAGLVVSRDGEASSFDGSTLAPIAARADMFELAGGGAPYRPPTGFEAPELIRQPELARSLELVAERGADVLYRGELAAAIVDDVRNAGGILAREDLATYRARELPPIAIDYRDHRVLTLPGLTGGPTVARALELLARADLASCPQLSAGSLPEIPLAPRGACTAGLSSAPAWPSTTPAGAA